MSVTATYEHPVQRAPVPWRFAGRALEIGLRGYLAFIWLRFGVAKVRDGWLTTNPLKPLLTMIGAEQLPTTWPGYAVVARTLVSTHGDAILSVAIPCIEIAIGAALLSGFRLRTTALVACLLNLNLLMSGLASFALDGRMIVLQLILVALVTLLPATRRRLLRRG